MSSISKTLGSVMKWSGRYSFFLFILSMVLTGVLITLSDPHSSSLYLASGETKEYQFNLNSNEEVQFFVFTHENEKMDLSVYKLTFENGNQTYNTRQSPSDVVKRSEIISASTEVYYDIKDLNVGEYIISITNNENEDFQVTIIHSFFNLGQIIATAISWSIFCIIIAVFFTILPFWLIFTIAESVNSSSQPSYPPPRTQGLNEQRSNEFSSTTKSEPREQLKKQPMRSSSTPSFIEGTQFEKLTRRDWAMAIAGGFFFIAYLSNPLEGFLLFMSAAFLLGVAYNVTEREKSKQRIDILLRSYPKVSIAFVAEQLDKKEDYVIDVLRIMILDEGYPIRLDLINRSVIKVGKFSGEFTQAETKPEPEESSDILEDTGSDTIESDDNSSVTSGDLQIKHGERGTVTEPWAYCQSCGEGLKQKIKYCYICGARQYN